MLSCLYERSVVCPMSTTFVHRRQLFLCMVDGCYPASWRKPGLVLPGQLSSLMFSLWVWMSAWSATVPSKSFRLRGVIEREYHGCGGNWWGNADGWGGRIVILCLCTGSCGESGRGYGVVAGFWIPAGGVRRVVCYRPISLRARWVLKESHRSVFAILVAPHLRSMVMARFLKVAMTRGAVPVLICERSSRKVSSRIQ